MERGGGGVHRTNKGCVRETSWGCVYGTRWGRVRGTGWGALSWKIVGGHSWYGVGGAFLERGEGCVRGTGWGAFRHLLVSVFIREILLTFKVITNIFKIKNIKIFKNRHVLKF